ncbi:dihydroneopterin aldolase [Kurthia sibirica]|uniref:7,8-dihydroneopterin aldolase n=1 Tax=Kurthia sibirica TaxID=202750 RepID=A0A2U3AIA7_9BACL|nr:dihydroneopterin aldolase [Kurthia sibirica]PWI24260.1 dihydroneopterin aldolase [Kurthia sibirica]GEK34507.1 7,8-dihydroneopterin aldolase [Kurthia sibirica]
MDYIHLKDMEFYGYHGVLAAETELGQRFRITMHIAVDLQYAGETDELDNTVSYAEVFSIVKDIVEGKPYKLIEAVAEKLASAVRNAYPAVIKGIQVEVIKPDPPIPGHYREVSVEITRGEFI